MLFVAGRIKSERLAICKACEHYVPATKSCGPLLTGADVIVDGEKKRTCGCVMPIKAGLRVGSCPLGKWATQISEEELQEMKHFLTTIPHTISASQQVTLLLAYNKVTGEQRRDVGCCGSSARNIIKTVTEFVNQSEARLESPANTREVK